MGQSYCSLSFLIHVFIHVLENIAERFTASPRIEVLGQNTPQTALSDHCADDVHTLDSVTSRELWDSLQTACLIVDQSGKIRKVNHFTTELLQKTTVEGLELSDLFSGWDCALFQSSANKVRLGSRFSSCQYDLFFSSMTCNGLYYVHLAEAPLDQSDKVNFLHRAVVEKSMHPILVLDSNYTVLMANQSVVSLFGYSKEAIVSTSVDKIIPDLTADVRIRLPLPYTGIRKDGKELALELNLVDTCDLNDTFYIVYITELAPSTSKKTEAVCPSCITPTEIINPWVPATPVTNCDTFAHTHNDVSILFGDIVGFTEIASRVDARTMFELLDQLFGSFDIKLTCGNVEKIKTIGDSYMLATGLSTTSANTHDDAVKAGIQMIRLAESVNKEFAARLPSDIKIQLRIGIHSGEVVSGALGSLKPTYDVYGKTVNYASRVESTGIPDHINISQQTYSSLSSDIQNLFSIRPDVNLKGIGTVNTYILKVL